jgi:SAM-dependent methyltransferase
MRNCQICGNEQRHTIEAGYCRSALDLVECVCGHRYLDSKDASQKSFDEYYLTQYTTDDKPYSDARLASLAECVKSYGCKNVLDIGGTDGELIKRLEPIHAVAGGIGTNDGTGHDGVILSHTLEHVYDIAPMLERVKRALKKKGYVFIEVPIHISYLEPERYDYHWQHVNKFRPADLEKLFSGFEIIESKRIEDYREYQVWRLVARNAVS